MSAFGKRLNCAVTFLILFGLAGEGWAAEFPVKAMEWLAPFGPGGPSAVSLKFIGDNVSKILGKPVLIVPVPGGGGTIAGSRAAKAKPDGYTLLGANSATNGTALLMKKDLPYRNEDFDFIAEYGAMDLGLAVKGDSPFQTLEDYIAYAQKNPSAVKTGTTGVGATDHLVGELLAMEAGRIKVDAVPFKSPAEKRTAILGGHVHSGFIYGGGGGPGDEFHQIIEGGGKILAVTTPTRLKAYPNIPTFAERGFNVVLSAWYGIASPKGIPKEIFQKLKAAIYKNLQELETIKMIESLGYRYEFRTGEDLTQFVKEREKLVTRIIREAQIPVN
jgi:tripartite-type tricarboxylate transporter receptor subunit TctC